MKLFPNYELGEKVTLNNRTLTGLISGGFFPMRTFKDKNFHDNILTIIMLPQGIFNE